MKTKLTALASLDQCVNAERFFFKNLIRHGRNLKKNLYNLKMTLH